MMIQEGIKWNRSEIYEECATNDSFLKKVISFLLCRRREKHPVKRVNHAKMTQTKEFPSLYAMAATGKVKKWTIRVVEHAPQNVEIQTETGYIDGKKTLHSKTITKGKSLGRANETTPWEQALKDAQSDWNKKKDRQGFQETPPTKPTDSGAQAQAQPQDTLLPMLAKKYDPAKTRKQIDAKKPYKGIHFPAAIQPKYDGIRAIARVDFNPIRITFFSRTQKEIASMPHLEEALAKSIEKWKKLPKNIGRFWLDGEFYHPDIPFSTVNGLLGRKNIGQDTPDDREMRERIQYWMFDLYVPSQPEMPFRERIALLDTFPWEKAKKGEATSPETGIPADATFQKAPLREAQDPDAVEPLFEEFLKEGYEGLMLRNWDSPYAVGLRSNDLQKYKPFDDAEFIITDYTEGTGDEAGLVLWVLTVPKETNPKSAGKTFTVRPMGTHEERARLFQEATTSFDTKFKGKKMTVRFDGWTSKQMPRDPRGVSIRWDLD